MLEIENNSPFPHFLFKKCGYRGKLFDVLVVRATSRFETNGSAAGLEEEQQPIVMADTYWDEPTNSSLKFETDLVLAKKRADIHVIGTAYSLEEKPLTEWAAGIRVGQLVKGVHLTGPRGWERKLLDWRISAPRPTSAVPLRYERAFGGHFQTGTPAGEPQTHTYRPNPVGIGYYDHWKLPFFEVFLAPQIESLATGQRIDSIHKTYAPEGMGPLSRWWEARVNYAGTYNEAWQKEVWPYLPDDFDFAFYNSAHPDLQYPGYLEGNEAIILAGLLPEAPAVHTALPGYRLDGASEDEQQTVRAHRLQLDTLTIDLDERLLYQTWRLTLPQSLGLRRLAFKAVALKPEGGRRG